MATLGDIRCSYPDGEGASDRPRIGEPIILISMDYKTIFPVVPYRKYVDDKDINGQFARIYLLDNLMCV